MDLTKQQLKDMACKIVDEKKDTIFAFADEIAKEPELGFKEYKTASKYGTLLDSLGIDHRDNVALTGVVSRLKGRRSNAHVAIMGELDAVVSPSHPDADPLTGAVHACGHNLQLATLIGVACGIQGVGLMDHLDGDISLMAVPAEEYAEIEFRNSLKEKGKIHFLGGKQEFIRLGEMDDVDIMLMQHVGMQEDGPKAGVRSACTGFVGKMVRYRGKAAHAGSSPHEGINALNAAALGLMAINAQRETFRDEDRIRVHPIITRGGDLVNVVPEDVRVETYVRGANIDAILSASDKVNRAFRSGGDAIGAKTEIVDLPGYLPMFFCDPLSDLFYDNLFSLLGDGASMDCRGFGGGSTDAGDVSNLIPTVHAFFAGATGGFHSAEYRIVDKELACITPAKAILMMIIDLLYDEAQNGKAIVERFDPPLTKQRYLKEWGKYEL